MKKVDIFDDEEFQSLDGKTKRKYTDVYFNENLKDDSFAELDSETQIKYKDAFAKTQIDFDVSDTADKVMDFITPKQNYTQADEVNDSSIHDIPIKQAVIQEPKEKYLIQNSFTSPSIDLNAPDKKLDVEFKEEYDDSNIIDQVQSSLLQQSVESARAVGKFSKRGLEAIGADEIADKIKVPESIPQEEADFIVGYSKANRITDKKAMSEIKDNWDKGDYTIATAKAIAELPSVLADSSGEIAQLLTGTGAAIAVSARVSKYEDEYIKNNDGNKPDAEWYAEAIASQTIILFAERFGIKHLGKVIKTKPKGIAGSVGTVGGGIAYEGGQEYAEAVSEEYLVQEEGKKSIGDIATSDNAKFSAFMGSVAGGGMSAGSVGAGKIFDKSNEAKDTQSYEKQKEALALLDPANAQMIKTPKTQVVEDYVNSHIFDNVQEVDEKSMAEFKKDLHQKATTTQDEFENLKLNYPFLNLPKNNVSIDEQKQLVDDLKAQGLDVSDSDGFNAITKGYESLKDEIGNVDAIQPSGVVEEVQTKPLTQQLQDAQSMLAQSLRKAKFESELNNKAGVDTHEADAVKHTQLAKALEIAIANDTNSKELELQELETVPNEDLHVEVKQLDKFNNIEDKQAENQEIDTLQTRTNTILKHPRYKELLTMRENVLAKDSESSRRTLQKGAGRELDGYQGTDKNTYDKATYEKNYAYDFELTKADVKRIRAGDIDAELLDKLEIDQGTLDNHPDYQEVQHIQELEDDYDVDKIFGMQTPSKQGTKKPSKNLSEKIKEIKSSVDKALFTTTNEKVDLGLIDDTVAKKIFDKTKVNLKGFSRYIDENHIRHTIKEHGDTIKEAQRGQLPITGDDIAKIPEITSSFDKVTKSVVTDKKGKKRTRLVFEKAYDDGTIRYVEATNFRNKKLSLKTMYKKEIGEAAKNSEKSVVTDLNPSHHSGGGATQSFSSKSITKEDVQSQDEIGEILAMGADTAGINYIGTYKASALPTRSADGTITLRGKKISLPTIENPISSLSLREHLKDIVGSRVYDKKVKGKSTLGTYDRINTSIRLKNYGDVEVQAHEMAHWLDFTFKNKSGKKSDSFFRKVINNHSDYLKTISYTQDEKLSELEGFAEFVRLWITNYDSLTSESSSVKSQKLVKEFEEHLAKHDKKLYKKLLSYQEEAHKFYYQGVLENARAKSGANMTKKAKKLSGSTMDENLAGYKQKYIDKHHSIKKIEAELTGDVALDAKDSAYKMFQLIAGADGTADMAFEYGVPIIKNGTDVSLDETKLGLDQIFKPIREVGIEHLHLMELYFKGRRAKELFSRGKENLHSEQEIDAMLDLGKKHEEFVEAFENYQSFNDGMLDFYVDSNLITKDERDAVRELNKDYVPFHRIKGNITTGETKNSSNMFQKLSGGTELTGDILENIYASVRQNIQDAATARAKTQLYTMIDTRQGGAFAVKVSTEMKNVKIDPTQQAQKIARVIKELKLAVTKDGQVVADNDGNVATKEIVEHLEKNPKLLSFWVAGQAPTSENGFVDSAIVGGKREYFEVIDPMLIETIQSATREGVSADSFLGKVYIGGVMYKNLSTALTTNNPLFYLTNVIRDTISAGALSQNGFIPVWHTLEGMYHFMRKDKVYKSFMVGGGGYSSRRTALGKYEDTTSKHNEKVVRNLNYLQKALHTISDSSAYGADVFEMGTRLGEQALAMRAGKSNVEGAFEGREVSTDFAKGGTDLATSRVLALIPFAKAGINSIDKLNRQMFEVDGEMRVENLFKFTNANGEFSKQKAKFYAAGVSVMAFSLALYAINKDDERYKRLTADQKNMYWWVYLGDGEPFKIPKPYDIGNYFASLPVAAAEYFYNKKETTDDAWNEWYNRTIFGLFQSGGVLDFPGIVKPTIEIWKNENWTGSPIESLAMQNLVKSQRAKHNTNPVYKALGNDTLSPVQVQHLANGFLGLTGKMIDDTLEAVFWDDKSFGERAFAKNIGQYLTSRVVGKKSESRTMYEVEFYDKYQASKKAYSTLMKYQKTKNTTPDDKKANKEWLTPENLALALEYEQTDMSQFQKYISEINKKIAIIQRPPNKSILKKYKLASQKEKAINKLIEEKHSKVKFFLDRLNSSSKKRLEYAQENYKRFH